MKRLSEPARQLFVQCGQRGGHARARQLAPSRRSAIAAQAARARWRKRPPKNLPMTSVRLATANWEDPVYLAEVLAEGTLSHWRILYHRAAEYPFGATSQALAKVLHEGETIYGVTPLWRGILRTIQGSGL